MEKSKKSLAQELDVEANRVSKLAERTRDIGSNINPRGSYTNEQGRLTEMRKREKRYERAADILEEAREKIDDAWVALPYYPRRKHRRKHT